MEDTTNNQNKRTRRTFDKEFKLSAVKMVVEQNQSVSSVARDLGIASNTLQNWKKDYLRKSHINTNNTDKTNHDEQTVNMQNTGLYSKKLQSSESSVRF